VLTPLRLRNTIYTSFVLNYGQLPEVTPAFHSVSDARYKISTNIAELLATSRSLLQHNVDHRISLLIDIMDRQRPAASLFELAGNMARASGGGAVLTDYKSAMILTLEPGKHGVEEIGELQTAHGPVPLWSLA
jgi:hypothetical protein